MPYCTKCGVQVDPNIDKCPLCSVFIPKYDQSNGVAERRYPLRDEKKPSFTNRQIRLLIWGILSILFVMSFLILLTTNLVQAGEITWERYYLAAIGLCWIYLTLILLCLRLPSFIILGIFIATSGVLALIDLFDGKFDWFLPLGLPIIGLSGVPVISILLFVKIFKSHRANLVGYILYILSVFCVGLEILISSYLGSVRLSWSLIFLVSACPIATLFIIYHYVIRKKYDIKKIFHI